MQGMLRGSNAQFRGVSTDTRTIEKGQLFVALQGPNFDGSKFVAAAAQRHAAAAVVADHIDSALPRIEVGDTRIALGRLAAAWRKTMPATVVGVTGSNGKTMLKEMIASCLSLSAITIATQGNLNNEIGVPLTLLRLATDNKYAVIEMGANHAGEIAYLATLASPDVVVINNAAPSHLEGFGSIEGVAKAKGEILQSDPRPKSAVLNADDPYFEYWKSNANDMQVVSFGIDSEATVTAREIETTVSGSQFRLQLPDEELIVNLSLPGTHNVRNACAAAATAMVLGINGEQIRDGLEQVVPVHGRLRQMAGIRGARVYDDSYNANPASVIAAAEFIAMQEGISILALADMGELGVNSQALHRSVGAAAKTAGIDRLMATGELSRATVHAFGDGASWYSSAAELSEALADELAAGVNVLVKGSRSTRMGRVVRAIQDQFADGDA